MGDGCCGGACGSHQGDDQKKKGGCCGDGSCCQDGKKDGTCCSDNTGTCCSSGIGDDGDDGDCGCGGGEPLDLNAEQVARINVLLGDIDDEDLETGNYDLTPEQAQELNEILFGK